MQYKEEMVQIIKNKAFKFYAELPEEARKFTMAEAKTKIESVNAYFKFIVQVNQLVSSNLLDFDADLPLEDIVELLKE